jgi:lysozyme family protein
MAKVNFSGALAAEYRRLYKECRVKPDRFEETDRVVTEILENRTRYESVADALKLPWYLVAAIHSMESGLDFSRHLHNGDPLRFRTVHTPAGRPKKGNPPFSWEESAIDALKLRRLDKVKVWSLPRVLYELEGYNGWGYRLYHPHVLTPYLWSGSNHYVSGKYIADGRWSDTARSKQIGAALIIRRLEERGEIIVQEAYGQPIFVYSGGYEPYAAELQEFLNRFSGIALRVDGWPGEKTSDAVKTLFGFYLEGDPRGR